MGLVCTLWVTVCLVPPAVKLALSCRVSDVHFSGVHVLRGVRRSQTTVRQSLMSAPANIRVSFSRVGPVGSRMGATRNYPVSAVCPR